MLKHIFVSQTLYYQICIHVIFQQIQNVFGNFKFLVRLLNFVRPSVCFVILV